MTDAWLAGRLVIGSLAAGLSDLKPKTPQSWECGSPDQLKIWLPVGVGIRTEMTRA